MRRAAPLAVIALAFAGCLGGGAAPTRHAATPAFSAGAAAERWPQPLRYSLDLAYDARRFALAGSERIELRNAGPEPLAALWLRTWGNAFGGCGHRHVRVTVTGGGRADAERVGCTALDVRLAEPLARGARTTLGLTIDVTAPRRPDRFGRYAGAAYFGNALPLLAVAGADGWSLPRYTFRGESFLSLSARWDVRLQLPPGVRAATTGTSEGDVTTAVARDFAIVAGPLRMTERKAEDVTLRHWRLNEPARDATRALRLARRALRAYTRWFGPYDDRDELDIVEGPHSVARGAGLGMEYPELVLTPARGFVLEHEVAHQWWYGLVGNDEYAEPWLDESFATYAGLRLAGIGRGCRPPHGRPPLTSSMRAFHRYPRRVYSRIVYRGGACALRTLERGFGRARFDRLLETVVREHRDGILTTDEFIAAVRAAATPGVDADALLERSGIARR